MLLIWCLVGLLLGAFLRSRLVALFLAAAVWAISTATVAARGGYSLSLDADSAGVFATLFAAMLGCLVGTLVRRRRAREAVDVGR